MAQNKSYGVIYKATNLVNEKSYIGQTIVGLEKRRRRHIVEANGKHNNFYFHNALKKYGLENFKWKIIEYCDSKEEMDEMEFHYIKQYNSRVAGYNLTFGGDGTVGFKFSAEQKLKLSKIRKGRKMTEEARLKLILNHADFSGENNPMYGVTSPMKGKHHTVETKLKISNHLKGRKFSDEHKRKISEAHKGKEISKETRKKLSDLFKGEGGPFYGRTHSEETKRKISVATKGRKVSEETRKKMSRAVVINNRYFGSVSEAAIFLKVVYQTVSYRIKQQWPGYKYA